MNTFEVEILNPKAAKLLKNLADMNLIAIRETSQDGFVAVLKKLRSKSKAAPTLDEITAQVEAVRAKR